MTLGDQIALAIENAEARESLRQEIAERRRAAESAAHRAWYTQLVRPSETGPIVSQYQIQSALSTGDIL